MVGGISMINCKINLCRCGSAKTIGLSILAFSIGVGIGMCCPLQVLAVIEFILLLLLGYICLFKW